jgi:mRNA-degrading endonuclease RelE of RelBE toxin-antitoxin system
MEIIFSEEFKKDFKRIKDKTIRLKIIKQIKKLGRLPEAGKLLRYNFRNHRSIRISTRISTFRIIYRIEKNKIIINCFDYRKRIYK